MVAILLELVEVDYIPTLNNCSFYCNTWFFYTKYFVDLVTTIFDFDSTGCEKRMDSLIHSQYILGHALPTFPTKISKTLAAFGDSLLPQLKWAEKGNALFLKGNLFLS